MKLGLFVALCLIAHSVYAVNFDVSQRGAFLVLKQEASGTLVLHSAIRLSHISSVTLDRIEGESKITIITSLASDSCGPTLKNYELKSDDRRATEEAFGQIRELLAREESEKSTSAKTPRRQALFTHLFAPALTVRSGRCYSLVCVRHVHPAFRVDAWAQVRLRASRADALLICTDPLNRS